MYLVGESTVAGVGATCHERALSGQLAQRVADFSSAPVRWEALGLVGARAHDCLRFQVELELIPKMETTPANLIVVVLGVNDTTKLTSRATWRDNLRQIVRRIGESSTSPILFTGVPPMERFTALPQPLRVVLGARSRMLDDDLVRIARESPTTHHQRTGVTFDAAYLAADGFHPSELGYEAWAERLGELASSVVLKTSLHDGPDLT
jgi:lysophospholipase L1-like esterase